VRRAVLILMSCITLGFSASAQEQAVGAQAALLRLLDRVSGEVQDISMQVGQSQAMGFISIRLDECRYPVDNPIGDAYARLTVTDQRRNEQLFSGWMLASSPALNPLDHARYDVWVLRCEISSGSGQ